MASAAAAASVLSAGQRMLSGRLYGGAWGGRSAVAALLAVLRMRAADAVGLAGGVQQRCVAVEWRVSAGERRLWAGAAGAIATGAVREGGGSGLCGTVSAVARVEVAVRQGAAVHASGAGAQVSGGVRTGEGHEGGQPVVGAVGQVSMEYGGSKATANRNVAEFNCCPFQSDWWCRRISEPCTLCSRISSSIRPNGLASRRTIIFR